ncbi:MAG: hypothetical protein K2K72_02170, partial [Duncaniella sp.]|nr:hypothetical protein [Duncaniella sp.]
YADLPHGPNAASAPDGQLSDLIAGNPALLEVAPRVTRIHFYGAGCAGLDICRKVGGELYHHFPEATYTIYSDMMGAARALCGDNPGIVGILGTGSNSCLYDGKEIIHNVSPLGYILGDEGSGAVIGRLFLGRMLKHQFSEELTDLFGRAYFTLTPDEAVRHVYREPRPNAFLASLCPFIASCLRFEGEVYDEVNDFLVEEFLRYIDYNLTSYPDYRTLPIHFVGSIAHYFTPQLTQALNRRNLHLGTILRNPLPSLAQYHLSHSDDLIHEKIHPL